jgi:hypothetical protein
MSEVQQMRVRFIRVPLGRAIVWTLRPLMALWVKVENAVFDALNRAFRVGLILENGSPPPRPQLTLEDEVANAEKWVEIKRRRLNEEILNFDGAIEDLEMCKCRLAARQSGEGE